MNKTELIERIADTAGISKVAAGNAVDAFTKIITDAMCQDDEVVLVGFGSFKVGSRAARNGRNPQTGKEIKIAASKVVKFKPGKKLKDAVNDIATA